MNHAVAVAAADAVPGGQDMPKIKVKQTTMKGPEWRLDVVQFMALMISAVFGLGTPQPSKGQCKLTKRSDGQVHYQQKFHLFRFASAAATNIHLRNGIIQSGAQISFHSKYLYLRT